MIDRMKRIPFAAPAGMLGFAVAARDQGSEPTQSIHADTLLVNVSTVGIRELLAQFFRHCRGAVYAPGTKIEKPVVYADSHEDDGTTLRLLLKDAIQTVFDQPTTWHRKRLRYSDDEL